MSSPEARVSVTVVSWNSDAHLPRCLDALAAQTRAPEVIVVDNASSDASARIAEAHPVVSTLERNRENRGFAGGQNQAIRRSRGTWLLTLNPESVFRTKSFFDAAQERGRRRSGGAVAYAASAAT